MDMKKSSIFQGIIMAVFTVSLVSCDSYLNKLPDNRMELESTEEVSKLLVSAYSERNPAYLLEMYSDNTDEHDNTTWTEASKFQSQAYNWKDITEINDDETPQQLWESYYSAVAAANQAISYIEGLDVTKQSDCSAQLGESLLCRAYSEFMLSVVFCNAYDKTTASKELGIPYPEKPETTVGQQYQRGTLAETYEKIDSDLQKGMQLVGSTYDHPKFHFTPTSAYAFAARFYLYYQKYDKAVEYATKVLGDAPASKLRDWASWNALSANKQIQPNAYVSSEEKANLLLQVAYSEWGVVDGPYNHGGKYSHGQMISDKETLEAPGPWGSSASVFGYSVFSNSSLSQYILRKIPYAFEYIDIQTGTGYPHTEYSVFNTDETLLVRAEAYALQGKYTAALSDINAELSKFSKSGVQLTLDQIEEFYSSIDYYTPDKPTPKKQFHTSFTIESKTQEPLLQCILQLRRIITLGEGFRMQDVKRYGIVIYRRIIDSNNKLEKVTDTLTVEDPRRAIQLPQDVITAGLEPNPRKK
jgi:hypothetical protein